MAQIAGKEYAASFAISSGMVHFQQHETRSENVPCDSEAGANSRSNLDRLARVSNRFEQLQRSKRILLGVKRKCGLVLGYVVTIAIVSIFFLQTSGIGQQYLQKIRGAARTVNRAMKTLCDKARQVTGMIDVRVGD